MAQHWAHKRHEGITMRHFGEKGVRAFSTIRMERPACFAGAWTVFATRACVVPPDEAEALRNTSAALIYCNVFQPDQLRLLVGIVKAISALGPSAPPIILVPHFVDHEHRMSCPDWSIDISDKLCDAVSAGLNDFVFGEPEGLNLVIAVRPRGGAASKLRARHFVVLDTGQASRTVDPQYG